MKNKFTLGVLSGISALTLAVPILAQVSNAASADTLAAGATISASAVATAPTPDARTPPTPPTLDEMITRETNALANVDAAVTLQKSTLSAHLEALKAAAGITDEAQRQAAIRAADEARRTTIDAAVTANPDLKDALMGFGGGHGRGGPGDFGHGHGPDGDADDDTVGAQASSAQ